MLINIILIVVVIISGWFLVEYNLFIRKGNKIKERESQKMFCLIKDLI